MVYIGTSTEVELRSVCSRPKLAWEKGIGNLILEVDLQFVASILSYYNHDLVVGCLGQPLLMEIHRLLGGDRMITI